MSGRGLPLIQSLGYYSDIDSWQGFQIWFLHSENFDIIDQSEWWSVPLIPTSPKEFVMDKTFGVAVFWNFLEG